MLLYYHYSSLRRAEVDITPPPRSLVNTLPACDITNSVDYFYYKEPQEKMRNNKFGLYIYAEQKEFLELAQKLVNSNGGDWGYVLIPYNITDRDYDKWRRVFDALLNKHLIPILQLWTVSPLDYKENIRASAEFLDRFAWPIKQRYISVHNEMNDARFWGGVINPIEYAQTLNEVIDDFKDVNSAYFILNGAFNISAATDINHLDAFTYMKRMNEELPGIFEKLDGWASHPYPQPNFTGDPGDIGRWSIRAYENELAFLKESLGVRKYLPVFITETGWAHAEGANYNAGYLPVDIVAEYFKQAFEDVWLKDDRIMAVIPFTVWYAPPYDHFAWVNKDGVAYKHYEVIKELPKITGTPESLEKAQVLLSCPQN